LEQRYRMGDDLDHRFTLMELSVSVFGHRKPIAENRKQKMITDSVLLNDWHPVCRESDLADKPVRAARLLGEDIVVWRAGDQVHVWQDLCLHRGAKLSIGKTINDELMCAYHGWRYGSEGKCTHIPAHPDQAPPTKAVVKTYHARTGYGMVWACLGQPPCDLPPFPEWHDASYRKVFCGPYTVDASAPRLVENFLDVAHFPFVHEGYLGVPDHPEITDYEAEVTDEGVVARGVRVYQMAQPPTSNTPTRHCAR
jgi:phenylpropionate dioxygenase-like ring-hydroxylating dioxygenase large terminal subunit